jgi:Effector-associated domain 1
MSSDFLSKNFEQLHVALLDAFPTYGNLDSLVQFKLGKNPLEVAAGSNLPDRILNLLTWVRSQNRLDELMEGAYALNPGNSKLKNLYNLWKTTPPVDDDPPSEPPIVKLEPAELRMKLARLLEESPSFSNQGTRATILAQLPRMYQGHLPGSGLPNFVHIVAVIQTLQNYSKGLTDLVQIVLEFDDATTSGDKLQAFATAQDII